MSALKNSAQGIVLINKPRGMTSFGVVSRLRKLTGIRRIGHCGTLDPFAEGLLPVCIGRATAAVQFMDQYDKSYQVNIKFGAETDTMDLEGEIINSYVFSETELQELIKDDYSVLRNLVSQLQGEQNQIPPMFSAVKVKGRPLYSYAREGKVLERKSRKIKIYAASIDNIKCDPKAKTLEMCLNIKCSKGTYIRVIADSIGKNSGYYAHASSLIRTTCGPYDYKQAQDIEDLFDMSRLLPDQASFVNLIQDKKILLPLDSAFKDYPGIVLSNENAVKLICGQKIAESDIDLSVDGLITDKRYVIYAKNSLIAIGAIVSEDDVNHLKTERVFINLEDFRSI